MVPSEDRSNCMRPNYNSKDRKVLIQSMIIDLQSFKNPSRIIAAMQKGRPAADGHSAISQV
jgi:hypothetical protein